ncbi:hypothetical protein EES45_08470 [Streptomyces sp. ADI97-07]|nr:hypothetical protein EES45_08470 [Streptomyces sp. ADI97-07]
MRVRGDPHQVRGRHARSLLPRRVHQRGGRAELCQVHARRRLSTGEVAAPAGTALDRAQSGGGEHPGLLQVVRRRDVRIGRLAARGEGAGEQVRRVPALRVARP